ncbi:DUF4342 domain-containing protein [Desulfitobacterium sp.]|uniref:DUF4342 domain-containing protein n=1 Tax=Desulfitobacterium sp. TaxID=49981 RepID=UPI002BF7556D|nr:DUF4342 domain-containing protein [Desulfitobacterium sp.]HVJ50204.1 DUF4342 domain-containing protein [Desulfitobacterium sp.]
MSEVLWTELEKVDVLRERMGISYEQARLALEATQGDLVRALAKLEEEQSRDDGLGGRLMDGLKEQIKRMNKTQLHLKHEDKTVLSMSAPLGVALAYTIWKRPTLRILGLLGAATAAVKHYGLEVDSLEEQEEYDEYPYDTKTVIVPDEESGKNREAGISE